MIKINVSELHLCQHCPRLFAYSRIKKKKTAFIGHKGTGNLPGTLFHSFTHIIQNDFSLNGPGKERMIALMKKDPVRFSTYFHELIKEEYLIPFLSEHGMNLNFDKIEAFSSACERWIKYLSDFISPHISRNDEPGLLLDKIFHSSEYIMISKHSLLDGEVIQVSGKPDALLFDPKTNEPVVLEYKGRKESDPMQDLAQTSLYAWLVSKSIGLTPRVDILYLEEEEPLVRYSLTEIQDIIKNHPSLFKIARDVTKEIKPIPRCTNHMLCQICPFFESCEQDFGENIPKSLSLQEPSHVTIKKPDDITSSPDELLSLLIEKLRFLSIPVIPAGYTIGPRFIRLKIIPDIKKKVTYAKIVNRAVDIQLGLALEIPPLIQAQGGYISCDVQRKDWEPFDVSSLVKEGNVPKKHACPFPLGRKIDGSIFMGDLADPIMTSCLIGGTSGSGKSELIRSMVLGITMNNPGMKLLFTLIDPKRVTFTDFGSFPLLSQPVITDSGQAMSALAMHVEEMEERYRRLELAGYSNISDYNAIKTDKIVRNIIVIDEYADLIMNKATKEDVENAIQKIGQKGRAAGLHLILATQRPDAKIITGVIKANLQLKIALKVTSLSNSRIILDEGGAECLAGYGDMLIGGSVPVQRLQSAKVSDRDFRSIKVHEIK